MGIRGLFSFVRSKDEFFEDFKLQDNRVIIDGNNLRYMLYNWCPGLYSCFGGDYDKYHEYVSSYFRSYLACQLTPIVVMDGAYDKSEMKKQTVLKRNREHIHNTLACTSVTQGKISVPPIFAQEVFLQALKELDIMVFRTSFEADHEMASLAKTLGCPVLSNDSDFLVYDVDLISLDSVSSFDVKSNEVEGKYLECKRFNKEKFMKYFGLCSMEMLYLMASLLGNDYIPIATFDKFFAQVKMPKKKSMNQRHKKMTGLLGWLSRESNVDEAIDKLMRALPESDRPRTRMKLVESLNLYREGGIESADRFDMKSVVKSLTEKDTDIEMPSEWKERYFSCHFPSWFVDATVSGIFFTPNQVELKSEKSANLSALPVIEEIVKTLIGSEENTDVQIYIRENSNIRSFKLDLDRKILGSAEEQFRTTMLLSKETFGDIRTLPQEFQLLVSSLYFWCCRSSVTLLHIKAIIISFLSLSIDSKIGRFRNKEKLLKASLSNSTGKPVWTDLCDADPGECRKVQSRLIRFYHMDENLKASSKNFDTSFMHLFSCFQSILYFTTMLNRLLGDMVVEPPVKSVINGTFIYNLYADISGYLEPEERLKNLIGVPKIYELYSSKMNRVSKILTDVCVESNKSGGRKMKSKKKKNRSQEKESSNTEASTSETDVVLAGFQNKFALLSMD